MQKEPSLPAPSAPLASNTAVGESEQASVPGVLSKSEMGRPAAHRKPSISEVILKVVEDKGTRSHVSLATLKKAVATTGYNMTRNAWRFKLVLKRLVDKGMLKQVTGRGTLGSFCMGKNHASKIKLKDKRPRRQRQRLQQRQQRRRHQLNRCQSEQRRPGQRCPGQHQLLLGSRQRQGRPVKGVSRVARGRGK